MRTSPSARVGTSKRLFTRRYWLIGPATIVLTVPMYIGISIGWGQTNKDRNGGITERGLQPREEAATVAAPVLASAQTTFAEMVAYDQAHPDVQPVIPPYMEGPGPQVVPFADDATTTDAIPRRDREQSRDLEGADAQVSPIRTGAGSPEPLAPPLITTFQGVVDNATTIPPDTHGAVGPNHVAEILNSGYTIYDRTGVLVSPQIALSSFWSSLGGAFANGSFDPKILFDSQSDRWLVVSDTNAFSANAAVLVGISTSNNPTGAYNLFAIDADAGNTTWADFPGLGVDTANMYVSNNMFSLAGGFSVVKFWVISKASMMAGGPLNLAAILESKGAFTYQPGHSFDNVPGGLNYAINEGWINAPAQRFLNIQRFTGVGAAATLTNLGFIEVATYNFSQSDATQPMCATRISTNDTRLLNAVVRMDKVFTTHSVGDASTKTEVSWYEVNPSLANPNGTNMADQQGRVSDPSLFYYFPSIAVNADKCIALGFSGSDVSTFASGYFTVHLPTDPPGTTQPVGLLHAGVAPYWKQFGGSRNRWGDYSATVVDPVDDRTFWTLQEYAETQFGGGANCSLDAGKWATWWGSFQCAVAGPEVKFSQPPTANGEDIPSNIDWGDVDPNLVVSDDFVSDGRPITGVRWWGSNLGEVAPICGDGVVNQPGEECDPPDDAACPGLCLPDCTCIPPGTPTDDCTLAPKVSEGTFPFSNVGATTDGPDEFPICDFFGDTNVASDVWVCYNPTCSGTATAALCGSGYDTKIAVYDGCTCPIVPSAIACNDDACGGTLQSEVTFPVTAGQSFLLRIGGFLGDQGTGTLTITCAGGGGPSDLFASDPQGASLGTVDPNTGLFTVIGPFLGAVGQVTEIEWSPDGNTLFATTGGGTSTIHTVDPNTGAILTSVPQSLFGALNGLEFDSGGTLLGTLIGGGGGGAPSDLVTVNPNTGVLTPIGPTGFGPVGGLAFDSPFTTLFGITSGGLAIPPTLLSVNPSTGAAVPIAVTTMPAEASSLEFTAGGQLVAGGADGIFYEINTATGVATAIGPLVNAGKLSGISLRPGGGGGPCSLANGGFESGDFTGWTPVTGPGVQLTPWTVTTAPGVGFFFNAFAADGVFFAENGFDGDAGLFYDIFQEITIPAGTTSAVLNWSERIQWDLVTFCGGCSLARLYDVTIQPAGGGAPIATLFSQVLAPLTTGFPAAYTPHSVDLLVAAPGIAGSTVRINWHQSIPESFTGPAQFELDAVSLTCTPSSDAAPLTNDLGPDRATHGLVSLGTRPPDATASSDDLRTRYERIKQGGAAPMLLDPPPMPSGGSGVEAELVGEPRWVELDDFVAGIPAPPPFQSDPALSADEDPGALTPTPRISFNGVIGSPVTSIPPDTHMAVGPGLGSSGRVVMVTNAAVQIWNKDGTVIASPVVLDTMFSTNVFDPKVLFDQHSGRFFIVVLEGRASTPNFSKIHIAVSSTSTPNNLTTDWTFLSGSAVTNVGGTNTWADYPGIGADSDSLFITTNLFTFTAPASFRGIKIRVFDKSALLAGVYGFADINFDDAVTNVSTTMPAHVYGTTTTGGFYLISRIGSTTYRLFHVTGDPLAPVAVTSTFGWSAGTFPSDRDADQCTVANPDLATLSSRVMAAIYRDGHVWLSLTADPDNDGETEVVWLDITPNSWPGGTPSVFQSGFINGTGTNPWTYMPSINVNAAGDAAITYSQSSTTECPAMYYVSRLSAAPLGTFEAPVLAKSSPGFYNSFLDDADTDRWGDYSATVVDPTDDCFWVANEFVFFSGVNTSEWGTFIASFCTTAPPAFCGDNMVNQASEECDGTDDLACPGQCLPDCTCPAPPESDGWFISFHERPLGVDSQRPPLALYYCDKTIVQQTLTAIPACDGHPVRKYDVQLQDCCLVHANVDARTGTVPATKEGFFEEKCLDYAIDIQAVVGHKFVQDPMGACVETPTGNTAVGDFWGWHTTNVKCGAGFIPPPPQQPLQQALTTTLKMVGLDWLYGPWIPISPLCGQPNMAFELLSTAPPVTGDTNGNCIPDQCECPPSDPPKPPDPASHAADPKVRYISFVPNNPGRQTALRVTLVASSLFPGAVGSEWWVGAPSTICENAGETVPPAGGCGSAPGIPSLTMLSAQLQCSQHCMDWGALMDVVHVGDPGIAPDGVYEVRAIDCAPSCDPTDPANFSPPLPIPTSTWGDEVSDCATCPCGPPNGLANILDVLAKVDKFLNASCAIIKARADITPTDINTPGNPDRKIDIIDVLQNVDALLNVPYPFPGPVGCP